MNSEWQPASSWEPLYSFCKIPKRICILDETLCDGFPLVNYLISGILKGSEGPAALLLISMRWPVVSFVSAGRRLGHDLNLAAMQGRFLALDAASASSSNPKFRTLNIGNTALDDATVAVKTAIDELRQRNPEKPLFVLVDGISRLCSMDWSLSSVFRLVQSLEGLADRVLVVGTRDGTSSGPLRRWLGHRMEAFIIVKALEAGVTRQAHGEILLLQTCRQSGQQDFRRALFKSSESCLLVAPKSETWNRVEFIKLLQ